MTFCSNNALLAVFAIVQQPELNRSWTCAILFELFDFILSVLLFVHVIKNLWMSPIFMLVIFTTSLCTLVTGFIGITILENVAYIYLIYIASWIHIGEAVVVCALISCGVYYTNKEDLDIEEYTPF